MGRWKDMRGSMEGKMKIIEPSYIIEKCPDGEKVLRWLETCCRVAYKSEDRIGPGTAEKLIRSILARGHESVIEHDYISVRFVCDRGVSHELVRHRLATYTQESTRYCDYAKKGIRFIKPCFWRESSAEYHVWYSLMEEAEYSYKTLIGMGCSPQEARSVLPNSLKTEIIVTANLREWQHILRLRTSKAAHPQMRELMIPLLSDFKRLIPVVFDDIEPT